MATAGERRSIDERVDALIRELTLEEKASQLLHASPAIERLGIPAYNWANECIHGVARAGIATVFPQAIGLAASWDEDLVHRVASAIADEARAKHHEAVRRGERGMYQGLTFWSPSVDIARDPRWGRTQETYGEDPHLTGRLAVAFIRGLQGDDPRYLKLVATPKHFAAHGGPEFERHAFDARVSDEDMRDTWLPAFETAIREGRPASVMTACSGLNGEPCSSHPVLLRTVLREAWGFDGYVVSGCGAIDDIYLGHRIVGTAQEAAARALQAGCDLECGSTWRSLPTAVRQGLIGEDEVDRALRRVLAARFRLGMFDPPEDNPYAATPPSVIDCPEHRMLALEAACRSVVLLENDGVLPFSEAVRKVAVIGPVADIPDVLLGNYHGTPSCCVTLLQGLRDSGLEVEHVHGCDIIGPKETEFADALDAAARADVAILTLGLTPLLEGEEFGATEDLVIGTGDRRLLGLLGSQSTLLEAVAGTGTPCVLVLTGGSAMSFDKHVPNAALCVWYPGQEGGTALADVLLGRHNPAGRLPLTFYQDAADLPAFEDYGMEGRTYRYFRGEPLYRFGHGLSYTRFRYSDLRVGEAVEVTVENVGDRAGDEVVQMYAEDGGRAIRSLRGFARVSLAPGERRLVSFARPPGRIAVGGGQPPYRSDGEGLSE